MVTAYQDYATHKQTFPELGLKYGKSEKTLRKYFDTLRDLKSSKLGTQSTNYSQNYLPKSIKKKSLEINLYAKQRVQTKVKVKPRINIVMDTTYFGRDFGVMVFRGNPKHQAKLKEDNSNKQGCTTSTKKSKYTKQYSNLYWKYLQNETVKAYKLGLHTLSTGDSNNEQGYRFKSFTIDNKAGLIPMLQKIYPDTPIQLCQFHQVQTVLKYITRRPKTECGKDIKDLILTLTKTTKELFTKQLHKLLEKHVHFIQEKNYLGNYAHQDIRSALTSIQTNLPYLFTYQRYKHLSIPNTTNSAEGSFGQWKYKVRLHRHQRIDRRKQIIDELLR